jgi:thiol:disulfide interchange protein DsbD
MTELGAPIEATLAAGNLGSTLALAFGAGVATSLTPCVYPMIAVTVSVFGAREAKSRREGALLSTSFVLGMAALFVPLGLIAAKTGGLFGAALSSPIVLVGLALLFTALAASMFGAFDLDLPSGVKTRLSNMGGVGLRGAFVLGMISALIAAPCTGPVLGALLTWVSSTGDLVRGALGLLAYALGLGLLFWLVGTFAVTLPKSGRWLGWVKSVFGIVMLAAAIYYVRPLLPSLSWHGWLSSKGALFALGAGLVVLGGALGALHLSFESLARTKQKLATRHSRKFCETRAARPRGPSGGKGGVRRAVVARCPPASNSQVRHRLRSTSSDGSPRGWGLRPTHYSAP